MDPIQAVEARTVFTRRTCGTLSAICCRRAIHTVLSGNTRTAATPVRPIRAGCASCAGSTGGTLLPGRTRYASNPIAGRWNHNSVLSI